MTFYKTHASKVFYDRWEETPESARARFIRNALDEIITFSRSRLPFYEKRLSGYEAKSPHPLLGVPVLTSSALREILPPMGTGLVVDKEASYTVFQSGGTTGVPKTTLFTNEELDALDLPNARGFFALGLSDKDSVGNFFAVGGLYMTFIHINRMLQQYGCRNFPFSNHTPVDFVHTVVKLFDVRCLTGIASVVLNALRGMHEIGAEGIHIEKVFYGGEHLYDADKKEIQEKFGTKLIAAPGYGTVDTWYLGYQCLQCPTGVFHAHDDQCFLEIFDEETEKPCDPGQVGMLYATPFVRRLTPIIRYRVGDRAKWIGEPCPCGRTTPVFKLLGRGDDVLRIGYDSIDYQAIQDCLFQSQGLSGTLQMEKKRVEGRDKLVLRVEMKLPEILREAARAKLEHDILNSRPSLRDFIAKGTVWPLEVELVNEDSIPRNPRTGKLVRVIDNGGA